ncbi:DUF3566 domain-containing protein [Bifidobacterium callimiconis]|uniref:DUF3566 domain-containing protein n=1 Tax=Bifidobacterium callimiconis TaxID=2306973 RepID=UPI001BDC91CF|nr:DUF3566 domain-containing protein [Bifidobacterium callimiconis]MBT1177067.1 DUF3566 domain-containing protein [Bifidobacterium callimiconis]
MSDEQSVPQEETVAEAQPVQPGHRTSRSAASSPKPLISEEQVAEHEAGAEPAPAAFKPASRPAKSNERKSSVPRARRMKLSLTKIDPWSVTKVSFLLSIAGALIQVIAVALIWLLLNSIGLFDNITQIVSTTGLDSGGLDIASFFGIGKVLSAVTIFSIFEIVLVTVLATIGAFLYNVVSSLVGGVHLTLGDD